jgi:hypothetical protein
MLAPVLFHPSCPRQSRDLRTHGLERDPRTCIAWVLHVGTIARVREGRATGQAPRPLNDRQFDKRLTATRSVVETASRGGAHRAAAEEARRGATQMRAVTCPKGHEQVKCGQVGRKPRPAGPQNRNGDAAVEACFRRPRGLGSVPRMPYLRQLFAGPARRCPIRRCLYMPSDLSWSKALTIVPRERPYWWPGRVPGSRLRDAGGLEDLGAQDRVQPAYAAVQARGWAASARKGSRACHSGTVEILATL